MNRLRYIIFLFFTAFFCIDAASGQQGPDSLQQAADLLRRTDSIRLMDSLKRADSIRVQDSIAHVLAIKRRDSITHYRDSANAAIAWEQQQNMQFQLKGNRYYRFFQPGLKLPEQPREQDREDGLFYYLAGILFFYALVRIIFYKYISNLLSLFFRITMRQQQVKEQLLQTPLASLLMNILFVVVGGTYLAFLSKYYHFNTQLNFWVLMLYSISFIALIYLGKFIFLKLIGWLFNVSQATDMYIFIVFWVNKILGILLLPFIIMLAFPYPDFHAVVITLSLILVGFLFLYRFFISYRPVRNEIKVNKFHFFLYLCAFEITPLVLIYKVLLNFVEQGT